MLQAKYALRVAAELPANFLRWVVLGEHPLSRKMFRERLGLMPPPPGAPGKRLLIDANGHGEYNQIHTFLRLFRARYPDWTVLLMSWNPEIIELAASNRSIDLACFAPWDIRWIARRYLRRLAPALLINVDQVRLPFVVKAARELGIRTIVIGANFPDVYITSVHLKKPLAYRFYDDFDRICVADEHDREVYARVGCDPTRMTVSGNMKFDLEFLRVDPAQRDVLRRSLGLEAARGIWVAGSVRPGEETIVLDAYAALRRDLPGLRLILAPRYVKDAALAQRAADERGLPWVLRSARAAGSNGHGTAGGDPVIILDTYGELSRLYAVADVTFIGNSLISGDRYALGQNIAEPLAHGKPVVFGPYMNKWKPLTQELMRAWDGLTVRDAAGLASSIRRLLEDQALAARVADATRVVAARYGRAVQNNFDEVVRLIDSAEAAHGV